MDPFQTLFMPHGHCYFWNPALMTLHVVSDAIIAMSYYSIPLALIYFSKKRQDLAFKWVFVLFGAFILACGTTHIMAIINIWQSYYWLDGAIKAFTALISILTAVLLWPLIPKLLNLPSPAELQLANNALQKEIKERERIQDKINHLNAELEERVAKRTKDLEEINQKLLQEIDQRRSAEKELEKKARALGRSNQSLEQFAYIASHDLREPLRVVQNFSELLVNRYGDKLDEKATRYTTYIIDGVQRMQQLIKNLLEYSRLTTENNHLQLTNPNEIVGDVKKNLKIALKEVQAEITVEELPQLQSVPEYLARIFQNLIENAIKYRHSKRKLQIHISAENKGSHLLFSVKDNGIGIAKESLKKVFTLFYRLSPSSDIKGTGLGLAICKKLVEALDGQIWVLSDEETGSQFLFSLPVLLETGEVSHNEYNNTTA